MKELNLNALNGDYSNGGGRDIPRAKRVVDLFDSEFDPVSAYIDPEVLPKGATFIFGGEAKIGKSYLMCEFARSLVTQKNTFGCDYFSIPRQARVLILEQELGPRSLKKRLQLVMADEYRNIYGNHLFYESQKPELQLSEPRGRKYVTDMIKDVRPHVMMLDPITMFSGQFDENSNHQVAELFNWLVRFKQTCPEDEMSIVLSHHFIKTPRGMDGGIQNNYDRLSPYNFRGAAKWKDTPDAIVTAYRTKEIRTKIKDGWEGWEMKTRWLTRHGSSPPEMILSVNANGDDARVRFVKYVGGSSPPKLKEGDFKESPPIDKEKAKLLKYEVQPI